MTSLGNRDVKKGFGLGFSVETKMEETIDPDIALSYIDEKLQDVLGHFQKDFEDGVSSENLGSKYGGYGSFLPTYPHSPSCSYARTPPGPPNKNRSISPNDMLPEGARQPSLAISANGKTNSAPPLARDEEDSSLKSKIVKKPTNGLVQKAPMLHTENLSTQKKAELYSGLGLDVSPSSSPDDSPVNYNEGLPHDLKDSGYESPTSILEIMTSYPIHDGLLLSPLSDDLLYLAEIDMVERSDVKVVSSGRILDTKLHDDQSTQVVNEVFADSSVRPKSKKTSKGGLEDMKKNRARDRYRDLFGDIDIEEDDDETGVQETHSLKMPKDSDVVGTNRENTKNNSEVDLGLSSKQFKQDSASGKVRDKNKDSESESKDYSKKNLVSEKEPEARVSDMMMPMSKCDSKDSLAKRKWGELRDNSHDFVEETCDNTRPKEKKAWVSKSSSSSSPKRFSKEPEARVSDVTMPMSKCDSKDSLAKRKWSELGDNSHDFVEETCDDTRPMEKKARVSKSSSSSSPKRFSKEAEAHVSDVTMPMSKCDSKDSLAKRKWGELGDNSHDFVEETCDDTRLKEKKARVSKFSSSSSPKRFSDGEKGSSSLHKEKNRASRSDQVPLDEGKTTLAENKFQERPDVKEKKARVSKSSSSSSPKKFSDGEKGSSSLHKEKNRASRSDQVPLDEEKTTLAENKFQERPDVVGSDRLTKNCQKESSEKLSDQSRFKEPAHGSKRENGANLHVNASSTGKKAKNQPHKVKGLGAPSSVRKESSSQAAASAMKEAISLKHMADRLKDVGMYFQSALKFLQGASLHELDNTKRGEMNPSSDIYMSTAKLCQFCAHEYERSKDMAAAALAYKCKEVAHMRVICSSYSEANRYRTELQTALQIFPPGESPFSSVSGVDNLNNPTTADKAALAKSVGSPQVVATHVVSAVGLVNLAQQVNLAMEASRRSRVAFAAAKGLVGDAQCKESILCVKKALDFNFQDVDGLIRLVRVATEAISKN